MDSQVANAAGQRTGRVRYVVLAMLFALTVVNYADRASISIAGPSMARDLGINAVTMGLIFSAFGWAYVIGQVPGGRLLDTRGSRGVYLWSLLLWSGFTFVQGGVMLLPSMLAVGALFVLRFFVGLAESPSLPANSRIVATWFPKAERGRAAAIFNSAQYFATVLFAPVMGWIAHALGWHYVFYIMGALGFVAAGVWVKLYHAPARHPWIGAAELAHIRAGGAMTDMDEAPAARPAAAPANSAADIGMLLRSRMMLGIFLGQYCISTLTYFFLTWFPVYLVQQRHMSILNAGLVAAIPAVMGFVGGILGGIFSDALMKAGWSLSAARKIPIVLGLGLSTCMVFCNYVQAEWLVVLFMAVSFFGKGIGALGWAVMSDVASRRIAGLGGGVFNMCGNISAITTPIIIGVIIQATGSYDGALVFVGLNAVVAIFAYLVIVRDIRPLEDGAG